MSKELIIYTYKRDNPSVSQIWDISEPLGLGHPFRWVIEKTSAGVRIRNLFENSVIEIDQTQLFGVSHSVTNELKIKFYPSRRSELTQNWNSSQIAKEQFLVLNDKERQKKYLTLSSAIMTSLILFSFVDSYLSRSKEEALIPPQFAKIILTPDSTQSSSQNFDKSNDADKRNKAIGNLIQTFQAPEVKKSTQTLLKGRALAILEKSDILSGHRSKVALNTIFDSHSKSKDNSTLSPIMNTLLLNVKALGGSANPADNSVGYGSGAHADLKGQGKSFVSLETLDSKVEEGLTRDEVGAVIHNHLAEVRYCYESAMIRKSNTQGKLIIDFLILKSGDVKTAKINSSSIEDMALDQCILNHLLKWKFPKPKGGVDVAVSYPFIFKTLGK